MTKYRVTVKTADEGWSNLIDVDEILIREAENFLYLIKDDIRFRIFAPGEWRQVKIYKKEDNVHNG